MAPQRNRITMWSSNSTSRYTPKRTERGVLRYCVSVFRAAQFTRAKRWKCLQMDERISKRWRAHIIEYYSTFKRREIPQYAYTVDEPWGHDAKWDHPSPKRHIRESHSYEVPESSQDQRAGPTGLKGWEELLFSGSGFHFASRQASWRWVVVTCTTTWAYLTPLSRALHWRSSGQDVVLSRLESDPWSGN